MLKLAPGTLVAPQESTAKFTASLIIERARGRLCMNGVDLFGNGQLQIRAGLYTEEYWSVLWLAA